MKPWYPGTLNYFHFPALLNFNGLLIVGKTEDYYIDFLLVFFAHLNKSFDKSIHFYVYFKYTQIWWGSPLFIISSRSYTTLGKRGLSLGLFYQHLSIAPIHPFLHSSWRPWKDIMSIVGLFPSCTWKNINLTRKRHHPMAVIVMHCCKLK